MQRNASLPAPSCSNDVEMASKTIGITPEENDLKHPETWKMVLITIALGLSVFCMALVTHLLNLLVLTTGNLTLLCPGQHYHRHGYSPHNGSVSRIGRHWLVRLRIFADNLRRSTHLWKAVHLLLCKKGISGSHLSLRNRVPRLRPSAQLAELNYWTSYRWIRSSWSLFRSAAYYKPHSSEEAATVLLGSHRGHVRHCFCGWTIVSDNRRNRMLSYILLTGSRLGGAFTDRLTWRWCFYINLPFGGVTVLFIILFLQLPALKSPASQPSLLLQLKEFDILGTLLFIPGIVSILLALQWGGSKYSWKDGRTIALLVIFGVLIAGFVAVQVWLQEKATVPPRILLNRSVWSASFFALFLGGAFFVMVYYVSQLASILVVLKPLIIALLLNGANINTP